MNLETELRERLAAFTNAVDGPARLQAWIALHDWTRQSEFETTPDAAAGPLPAHARQRLALFIDLLGREEGLRVAFLDNLEAMLSPTHGINLFGEAGIPSRRGFWAALRDRIYTHLLPVARNDDDLANLLDRQFRTPAHLERFVRHSRESFHAFIQVISPAERRAMWRPLRRDFADAFRLLATRLQAEGLSDLIRERLTQRGIEASPFFSLARTSEKLLIAWESGKPLESPVQAWEQNYRECHEAMAEIRRTLQQGGVSTDVVFSLHVIQIILMRMKIMVTLIETPPGPKRSELIQDFVAILIESSLHDRSITHLLRNNLQHLHRTIVTRSAETGEHYIADDKRQYAGIWLASAGGGLLTAGTAAIKMTVHHYQLPPLVEGLAYGLNYAVSFLLLGAFHLMLATKQPAMTAARLATIMNNNTGKQRIDRIVDLTVRIVHSQIASALANVFVVSLGAFAIDQFWRSMTGHAFLDLQAATETYETLSPLSSGTVIFAALTGVILFASSIVGGWFDNWFAFHRLAEAIAGHRWTPLLGSERMARLGKHVGQQIGPWMTSISLGFMLGLTPTIGRILGIPLDVRHVTLSTGILSLAAASLGQGWFLGGWFWHAIAGIATMFVLNLSVSFFLSLYTAAKAFGLAKGEIRNLMVGLVSRLASRPFGGGEPLQEPKRTPQP